MDGRASGRPEDEAAVSMLDALFHQSPIGLHLLDSELRVVRVNTATPVMRGVSVDDLVGRPAREVYDMVEDDVDGLLGGVLDTGVPLLGRLVRARLNGVPRYYELTALRLQSPSGAVLGVAAAVVDVTEQKRAEARTGVLGAVRTRVGRSLDPAVTGEELAATVVPGFADAAVVEVVDTVLRGDDPPLAPLPPGVPLLRTAFAGGNALPTQAFPVGEVCLLPAPTPFSQALTDLRPRLLALGSDLDWGSVDGARARTLRSVRAHSLLVVPLTLHGAVLGLISLYRREPSPPFETSDLALAVEMATHTALCMDNARRYIREHAIAATVHRQLLPRRPQTHASIETSFLSVAGVGPGAWYDTIALPSARTALVAGRVSGRPLSAAATMGQLRTAIRSLAAFDLSPDELLARLHGTADQLAAERACLPVGDPLRSEALTAECVYAVHDPLTGRCTLAAAGCLTALVVHPDATVTVPTTPAGPRLGTTQHTPFVATDVEVPDGSVLVVASDPGIASSLASPSAPLASAPDLRDRPLQDLCDTLVYRLPPDVIARHPAVIVARTRAFPPDRCASWQLDQEPAAAALARRHTRGQLAEWGVDDDICHSTQLIVSELVTNAVRYGMPPILLRLIHDSTLTCEVRDAGLATPHLRHAGTTEEGGRGLFITAQLADTWGTRYTPPGKTIWTEQTLSSPT
ncbi:SpoIIE family protein phosphatase [Streptomyces sp. NRRL S-118]|uniref:SpoIIE family protein phosphatase n=1 Tax=Streptomyces sp. NRRL S-118 TaxID=1463881 RepID=UPI0004C8CA86|nr:SpoIIE family protein phosphatase [Streptomyces sp. NRRL S-118]